MYYARHSTQLCPTIFDFMKRLYLLIALFSIANIFNPLLAQTNGHTVKGIIAGNQKKIEAATIYVLRSKDSSITKTGVSDKDGYFTIDHIGDGNYLLSIEAIGYKKFYSNAFKLTLSDKATLDLHTLSLLAADAAMNTVVVTSKRPFIEQKIDKTVVNVDASPTNTGLSALEVLEKSPGVTVDNNNNISLKGKQGVIILVDGKPTYLNGDDLANYLKNMSANQIDQIEIMSQPSAKYDASGNSGIINIKTKKNKAAGFNGNISTSAIFANYFKNTNSINLNWRKNKVNLFGNYGYSYWEGFNDLYINRSSRANRDVNFDRYSNQYSFNRYSGRPQNFKAGIDYYATKKTTLGVAITGNLENDKNTSDSRADIYDSLYKFSQFNQAYSTSHEVWNNLGFNLNFQQKLDTSGSELTADADYIFYHNKNIQDNNNYLFSSDSVLIDTKDPLNPNPYLLHGNLPSNIDIYTFKSDYHHPLKKGAILEAGIKVSYVKTDNDAQYTLQDNNTHEWFVDSTRSNHFIYKENINAAYVNLQKEYKKWSIQLGLRAEQTIADGNQVTKNEAFHKNYTKLFPTTYLSYKADDKNTFALSYGRRIERPGYESLNPFQYQLDRYTYRQGNPLLQPQFSHNIELSYNYKGQLNITANYTRTTDIINDVLVTLKQPGDSNYTTYQTSQNIASSDNVGLAVSYNKQLVKWWTVNVFTNVYYNHYKGVINNGGNNEDINTGMAGFMGNMSNQFDFGKGWTGELSGWFRSEQLVSSTILAKPMGMFSFGGAKKVLKGNGSVRVNVRDPFYLASFRGTTDTDQGVTTIKSKWDNRRFILSFNYRFGKSSGQQQRRRNSASEDEQNRIHTGSGQQ